MGLHSLFILSAIISRSEMISKCCFWPLFNLLQIFLKILGYSWLPVGWKRSLLENVRFSVLLCCILFMSSQRFSHTFALLSSIFFVSSPSVSTGTSLAMQIRIFSSNFLCWYTKSSFWFSCKTLIRLTSAYVPWSTVGHLIFAH